MKLVVCSGTYKTRLRTGAHPCRNAYDAPRQACPHPNVGRGYGGAYPLTKLMAGRHKVKQLTDQSWVPVLVSDDGEVIQDSRNIIAWAHDHTAPEEQVPRA